MSYVDGHVLKRENQKWKVCVLGLGEVGYPTARYVSMQGHETWGYDKSSEAIRKAKNIRATSHWDRIPHESIDVYIVCVWTGISDSSKPDMSAIYDVSKKIMSQSRRRPLVSIESTVSVGTCRKIHQTIFEGSVDLVHVPHRYWKEFPVERGVKQDRVIGGVDTRSLEKGFKFYGQLNVPLFHASTIEIAEASKIVENAYRYLQIAFAEELRMVCGERGWSFKELRDACNTKWNIEILDARDGIGGHCLPKDARYLVAMSKHNLLLKNAITADQRYRRWLSRAKER